MDIFGYRIETFALTAMGWLAIEFIRFSWNRGTGRKSTAAEPPKPFEPQLVKAITLVDTVVPFRRSAPKLTDCQLIQFAKSINYTDSRKWSSNCTLSGKVRSNLIQFWAEHQQLKAG